MKEIQKILLTTFHTEEVIAIAFKYILLCFGELTKLSTHDYWLHAGLLSTDNSFDSFAVSGITRYHSPNIIKILPNLFIQTALPPATPE